jgi:Zn-dependent protease
VEPRIRAPGTLRVGKWKGAPILVHWTAPIGALFFSGFRFAPGLWVGVFLIIVLHELGHAFFVRRFGLKPIAIVVHGLGGECHWVGTPTPVRRSLIAWGGVIAQAIALAAAAVVMRTAALPGPFTRDLVSSALGPNLWMMAINLFPVRPLDGFEAWKIFRRLRNQRRGRLTASFNPGTPTGAVKRDVAELLERIRDENEDE